MTNLNIRQRTPDDDQRILDLHAQVNPDFPRDTVEEWRQFMELDPPDANREILVAEMDGEVVAECYSIRKLFVEAKTSWMGGVVVDEAHRRQGIGSRLTEHVIQRVRSEGAEKLFIHVREHHAPGRRFAERYGFEPTGTAQRSSMLELANANDEGCQKAFERMEKEGIRIATVAELGRNEDLLQRIYQADVESSRDIPSSEPITLMPYEEWMRWVDSPVFRDECTWIALDGEEVAGLAILHLGAAKTADNAYTGVVREYRGRGIARALKYATIVYCRENGYERIFTGNEQSNKPMLAINNELGYQPVPVALEYVKELTSTGCSTDGQED